MTERTDIHRPKEFDPADYRVVDYLDNKRPEPPITGGREALEAYERFIAWWQEQIFQHFPNWRTGGGDHKSIFQCNHCGHQHIRYVAVVEHIPTGAKLAFGEICADRTELPGRDAFRAKYVKDAAARELARYEKARIRAEYREAHPELVEWLESLNSDYGSKTHPFLLDMKSALSRHGELSEAQTEASEKWRARDVERQAERDAEPKPTEPLAEGRYMVEGEILTTKLQDSYYGETLKMLVRLDDLNKVWGTVPSAICDVERGQRVRFTAKVERSKDDQHFGFFSRPSKAEVVQEEAA